MAGAHGKKLGPGSLVELQTVLWFIADCKPHGFEAGVARYAGAYTILREVFAPVMKHKGAKPPEAVTEAARVALERISGRWPTRASWSWRPPSSRVSPTSSTRRRRRRTAAKNERR